MWGFSKAYLDKQRTARELEMGIYSLRWMATLVGAVLFGLTIFGIAIVGLPIAIGILAGVTVVTGLFKDSYITNQSIKRITEYEADILNVEKLKLDKYLDLRNELSKQKLNI